MTALRATHEASLKIVDGLEKQRAGKLNEQRELMKALERLKKGIRG